MSIMHKIDNEIMPRPENIHSWDCFSNTYYTIFLDFLDYDVKNVSLTKINGYNKFFDCKHGNNNTIIVENCIEIFAFILSEYDNFDNSDVKYYLKNELNKITSTQGNIYLDKYIFIDIYNKNGDHDLVYLRISEENNNLNKNDTYLFFGLMNKNCETLVKRVFFTYNFRSYNVLHFRVKRQDIYSSEKKHIEDHYETKKFITGYDNNSFSWIGLSNTTKYAFCIKSKPHVFCIEFDSGFVYHSREDYFSDKPKVSLSWFKNYFGTSSFDFEHMRFYKDEDYTFFIMNN